MGAVSVLAHLLTAEDIGVLRAAGIKEVIAVIADRGAEASIALVASATARAPRLRLIDFSAWAARAAPSMSPAVAAARSSSRRSGAFSA